MTGKIVDLADRRPPVCYTVRVTQSWDGGLTVFIEDVADDQRSREAVAHALERAAILVREGLVSP